MTVSRERKQYEKALCIISAAILLAASLAATSLASPAWSGDATGDGVINAKDVVAVMRSLIIPGINIDTRSADVNCDGKVTVTDAVAIVNYILENPSSNFNEVAADVNGDGKISITDAVAIINIIHGQTGNANGTLFDETDTPQ